MTSERVVDPDQIERGMADVMKQFRDGVGQGCGRVQATSLDGEVRITVEWTTKYYRRHPEPIPCDPIHLPIARKCKVAK